LRTGLVILLTSAFLAIPCSLYAQSPGENGKPLKIGIVGFHHDHVFGFFRNYLHRTDIDIVGYVEPDKTLAQKIARRYQLDPKIIFGSVDELIEKAHPQAVCTYTSTFEHRAVVETCARHGVHVMMEKPLAVSLADALAMQKAAEAGHIHVLVNYETSWYRSNHAAQELLAGGAIGELRKVVVHDGHRGPREIGCSEEFLAWLTDPKLNGAGALFDFGCYGADLATWLMNGQRPVSVTAVALHIKPDVYPKVEDEATVIVKYPRAQAILQASWNWPFDRKDMEVYGKTGQVFTVAGNDIKVRLPGQRAETQKAAPPVPAPYDDQITYLRAVVIDGAKVEPLSSLETNITVTEILDAARRSIEEGKTVELPPSR
jgi:scyllo-inositol 2-dehydrogenase (NADP+)